MLMKIIDVGKRTMIYVTVQEGSELIEYRRGIYAGANNWERLFGSSWKDFGNEELEILFQQWLKEHTKEEQELCA